VRAIDSEQEMHKRIENPAGVVGGEVGSGFDSDDDQPENGCDPRLEDFASVRVQAGRRKSKFPPCRKRRDEGGAPDFFWLQPHSLFDGIVRSLAGDHDIVHMALPEACAADADETRFLQQFGNGRAAAVTHA